MLFNKSNNGQAELKSLLGFLHASNNFENIKTDIILAEESIIELVGRPLYDRVNAYYNDDNVNGLPVENPGTLAFSDEDLLMHMRLPIAYYATYSYAAHNDVSHGDDGRKVRIDAENEKMAWDWMIDRDDEATLNKAHKTTDRLISYLETFQESIPEWKNSDAQKLARSLFINTAKDFDYIFPIDNSRRFFLKILPFMRESERKFLLPVLGKTRFDAMKAAIQSGSFTDEENILQLIKVPLVYFTLSIAVKRLSINMHPSGIFQDYISDRLSMKAKAPAPAELRHEISKGLMADAQHELENLQKEISKMDAEAAGVVYEPVNPIAYINPENQIFRI